LEQLDEPAGAELLRHLLGLFDRPAEPGAIAKLRQKPAIPGLTQRLQNLDNPGWNKALSHLRKSALLTTGRYGFLDCHALVREYFGERFRSINPRAWRAAHLHLYKYFCDVPKKVPDTLAEMEPLFQAIIHGCNAGLHQKALRDVYWQRIQRSEEALRRTN
jgi:hypothetical protein